MNTHVKWECTLWPPEGNERRLTNKTCGSVRPSFPPCFLPSMLPAEHPQCVASILGTKPGSCAAEREPGQGSREEVHAGLQ